MSLTAQIASAGAASLTEYSIPTAGSGAFGLVAGGDGNVWFAENLVGKIGRITPAGVVAEFPLRPGRRPRPLVLGADGNLWFSVAGSGNEDSAIARITPSGKVVEFAFPTPHGIVSSLTSANDGNVWFAGYENPGHDVYGRISPDGEITPFVLPTFEEYYKIVAGSDGYLWLFGGKNILRITLAGEVVGEYSIPLPESATLTTRIYAESPIASADGNIWFRLSYGSVLPEPLPAARLGRIAPSGEMDVFSPPNALCVCEPVSTLLGPDRTPWVFGVTDRERTRPVLSPISPDGSIGDLISLGRTRISDMTFGADGSFWFVRSGNKIGKLALRATTAPKITGLSLSSRRITRRGIVVFKATLSEKAVIAVTFSRAATGRRAAGLTFRAEPGKLTRRFKTTIGAKRLTPGLYRISITATTADKRRSRAKPLLLRVV